MCKKSLSLLFLSTLLGIAPLMATVNQAPEQLTEEQKPASSASLTYPILGAAAVATLGTLWWAFGRRVQPGRSARVVNAAGSTLTTAASSSNSSPSSSGSYSALEGLGEQASGSLDNGISSSSASDNEAGSSLVDHHTISAVAATAATDRLIRAGRTVVDSSIRITGTTRIAIRRALGTVFGTFLSEETNVVQENEPTALAALLAEFDTLYATAIAAPRDFEASPEFLTNFNEALRGVLAIRKAIAELDERLAPSNLNLAERQAAFEELKAACKKAIEDKARELNKAEQDRQLLE